MKSEHETYFKMLKPYIIELITFIIIVLYMSSFMIYTKRIVFNVSPITILVLFCIGLWFIQYVFTFVPFSILVLVDFIFKKYEEVNVVYVEQFVFKSSAFLNKKGAYKKGKPVPIVGKLFYKIIVKDARKQRFILTSSEYFEFESQIEYTCIIGKHSKALLNIYKKE